MFKNPGKSLKTYGKIVFIIFVIAAIAGGISMFAAAGNMGRYSSGAAFGMVIGGIVVIAVGIFLAYLLSIFVIAFGELVENSTIIRTLMENGAVMPKMNSTAVYSNVGGVGCILYCLQYRSQQYSLIC